MNYLLQIQIGHAFLIQIDCFESCIAFFFFVLLAEVEQHAEINIKASANLIQTLHKGAKLSTGHWWALLRDLSKDVHAHKDLDLSDASNCTQFILSRQTTTSCKIS